MSENGWDKTEPFSLAHMNKEIDNSKSRKGKTVKKKKKKKANDGDLLDESDPRNAIKN